MQNGLLLLLMLLMSVCSIFERREQRKDRSGFSSESDSYFSGAAVGLTLPANLPASAISS